MTIVKMSLLEMGAFIDEVIGMPVEVNDAVIGACREAGVFGGLSFALLKSERATMCSISVSLMLSNHVPV